MSDILNRVELHTPEQARAVLTTSTLPWIGEQLKQGRELVLEVRLLDDARSLRQNAFYWGWVLKCISVQAAINGIGAKPEGWHWILKKQFLGYRFKKISVPGSKRPVVRKELRSTTDLSVKQFGDFLEQAMAFGASLGVEFDGKTWEEYRG